MSDGRSSEYDSHGFDEAVKDVHVDSDDVCSGARVNLGVGDGGQPVDNGVEHRSQQHGYHGHHANLGGDKVSSPLFLLVTLL